MVSYRSIRKRVVTKTCIHRADTKQTTHSKREYRLTDWLTHSESLVVVWLGNPFSLSLFLYVSMPQHFVGQFLFSIESPFSVAILVVFSYHIVGEGREPHSVDCPYL